MNCYQYFGMLPDQVRTLTLRSYRNLMKAEVVKGIEDLERLHLSAWKNQVVQGVKKKGDSYEPIYKEFKEFFDKDKYLRALNGESERPKKLSEDLVRKMKAVAAFNIKMDEAVEGADADE